MGRNVERIEMRKLYKILVEKSEDLGVAGKITLKLVLREWRGRVWTGFIWLRIGTVDRLL
jgi:hypothetical protein